jgi:hypothetical protein
LPPPPPKGKDYDRGREREMGRGRKRSRRRMKEKGGASIRVGGKEQKQPSLFPSFSISFFSSFSSFASSNRRVREKRRI